MLTIAIPFFRGQEYLKKAIESVLAQSDSDFALLISDDCGPESGTEALVNSYRDPRISYFRNERNLGMAGNWNRCLDLANTDMVTLLHCDDELCPNYTQVMRAGAERHPAAALLFCGARIIDARSRPRFSLTDYAKRFYRPTRGEMTLEGTAGLAALMRGNFIMCPTVCFRKSALGGQRFSSEWKFVLDLDLFTRLLIDGQRFVGFPEIAYAYRRHPENSTVAYTESLLRFEEEVALFHRIRDLAKKEGWRDVERISGGKRVIRIHLLVQMAWDLLRLRPRAFWSKLSFLMKKAG